MNQIATQTPTATHTRRRNPNRNKPTLPRICVSVREAAEITGLSKSTIYNLISDGRLPSAKVGGRKLIWLEDLHKFLSDAKQNQ